VREVLVTVVVARAERVTGVRAIAAAFVAALALSACATPSERFRARVAAAGLSSEIVRGSAFDHLVVRKPGTAGSALHVYIEGDGLPWRTPELPSDDPTPSAPLAFEMMLRDSREAIYLGRPCYFAVRGERCGARAWTDERYSEAVVASMAAALRAATASRGDGRVRLVGHSGGGVIAVLLAQRLPDVVAVITVGANLDVARWAALHHYTPLAGSLDPARLPAPGAGAARVPEFHYVGGDDRVVPPEVLRGYAQRRAGARVIEWPRFDHVCCWIDAWPGILAKLDD
jgi:pimeloyl-ACP methyl ester carboxylesterase